MRMDDGGGLSLDEQRTPRHCNWSQNMAASWPRQKQQILLDTTAQLSEAIGKFLTGQQQDMKDFLKEVLNLALSGLEKVILLSISSSTEQSLAQPDSVATFGASGLVRAGILSGLIKEAFTGIKTGNDQIEVALLRILELEQRLKKNSRNSDKPPSSDK